MINQVQRSDAGACQRFHHVAADTADAEHRNACTLQSLYGLVPVEACHP